MILGKKTEKDMQKGTQEEMAATAGVLTQEKHSGRAKKAEKSGRRFLYEDTKKENVHGKYYVGNDGTVKAVYGNRAVRYKTPAGDMRDVDNRLEEKDGVLTTRANVFQTKFYKTATDGKLFEMQKKGSTVLLSSEDMRERNATGFVCEENGEQESRVLWQNVRENVDLQYIVDADRVKENIIVKERAAAYEYDFSMELGNMSISVSEDGKRVLLKDKESGETRFYIPVPVMYDANGVKSDLVYYELEEETENLLKLKVVADEEWMNAEERSFPVKIDPQIVSSDTSVMEFKYYQAARQSSSGWQEVTLDFVQEPAVMIDSEHKLDIIIDKKKFDFEKISFHRILSAKLKIYSLMDGGCCVNDVFYPLYLCEFLEIDITDVFNQAGTMGLVTLKFSGENNDLALLNLTGENSPELIVEYSENKIESKQRSFAFSGGTKGIMDAVTGECALNFSDISAGSSVLPLQISHVHKKNETDFGCGSDWRLNLHQKLEKNGNNYVYTDASGWKHLFEEVYYYVKDSERCAVAEEDVTVGQDGNLTCRVGGATYDVTRELRSDNGMRLMTRLDGGKNVKYIDQREDEEKQVEQYIKSCKNTFDDLHIVSIYGDCLRQLNYDTPENFEIFIAEAEATTTKTIMSYSEFLEFFGWMISRNANRHYAEEDSGYAGAPSDWVTQYENLMNNTFHQREEKIDQVKELYKEYLIKLEEQKALKRALPVAYLTDDSGTFLCFNESGNLCAVMDRYENYIAVEWGDITTSSGTKTAITSVYEGEKVTSFRYNRAGQLKSITSPDGNRVEYTYTAATSSGTLKKVKFSDGRILRFAYTANGEISSVRSASEQSQTKLEYTSNGYSLKKITNQSLVSAVTSESVAATESELDNSTASMEKTVSVYDLTYGSNDFKIANNGKAEYIYYDFENFLYANYAKNAGKVDNLSFGKTVRNEFSFKVTPKKTSEMLAPASAADSIIAQRLGSAFPEFSSFPDMTDEYSTFAEADWEDTTLDSFNRPQKTTTNWQRVGTSSDNKAVYACTETVYTYAAEDPSYHCLQKTTTTYVNRNGAKSTANAEQTVYVEKYSYCEHGNLVKTESYVEGEEGTSGVNVTQKVCDDKGNIVKEFSYNTLDSGTKFYTESDYAEDGKETASYDETGENKTALEYVDGTNTVRTQVLPNGSKFSYGYDAGGQVTSVAQSTSEGESNQTTKKYNLNCVTLLTSGNNVVQYEYDHKRRVKKVTVNGTETNYAYAGSAYDDTSSVTYEGKPAEQVTVTRGTAEPVQAISYTDKFGNVLAAELDGETQYKNTYNADDTLQKRADEVTGSETDYTYTTDGTKKLKKAVVSAGTDVSALTEEYTYNDYGQTASKTLTGAVSQTYGYCYKDNAARDVECITLPNGFKYYPQKDVNGRSTGRELTDTNGNRKYGEYIYYRKVGDHATNMPASVYYGMTKNGQYVIGENVKYSYDGMGNISKVFENGAMTVQYTYDALNRLVREDNKKLGKTYFISYDNCGNILSKRETAYTLQAEEELAAEVEEVAYGYEANSDRLTMYNGGAITYDEFGNPTSYRGNTLEWKYGKFLEKYGSTTFAYDGYGRRIRKGNTVFTYDNEGNLIRQSDGTNTLEFIYDGNGLCGVKCNDINYLYRKNAQGDITHILDNTGMVVAKYVYDAWGNHAIVDANGNDLASGIGVLNPFRYRGYYYDTETDLYYLQTRYYDPEVGRFISQDDVSYLAPDSINGLNLYAYCANNPVMNVDLTGTEWWEAILVIAVAVVVVAVVAAVTVATGGTATPVLVGAGIGALSNGAISIGTQLATTGTINWEQVLVDSAIGAVTGAFGGSALGRVGLAIANGATEFAGSLASDWVAGEDLDFLGASLSAVFSVAGSLTFGGGAQYGKLGARKAALATRSAIKAKGPSGYRHITNYTFGLNSNKMRLNRVTKELNKAAIKEILISLPWNMHYSTYQSMILIGIFGA